MKKFIVMQILCFVSVEVLCKKYDLEAEAMKLYGEDFDTVLKRFRKTPDYLAILNDKLKELNDHKDNIVMMTTYHYIEKLNKKISDMVGLENDQTTTTAKAVTAYFRNHLPYRRQQPPESAEVNPVRKLDNYPRLSSILPVSERNSFMDLGFEYAGHILHTVIKSMGPDDEPVKSTRQPYGDLHQHKTSTTTEHVHVHEVTPTNGGMEPTKPPETTNNPATRYRYKAQRP